MKAVCLLKSIGTAAVLAAGFSVLASAQTLNLKLGNEGTYPPFAILATDGTLTGMEPDLAREMCKRIGAECEILAMDFKALLPSLITGKIDLIVSQLTPLPERLEKTEFSRPVVVNPEGFVVPKDWNKGYDNAAFKGVRIGVQKGSGQSNFIETQRPDAVPVYYENPDQIKLDLLVGRIDAVFGAKINYTIDLIDKPEGRDWKISEEDFWPGGEKKGASWAAQKGNTELIAKVDKALNSMIEDCTYTKIRKNYLSVKTLPEEPAKCM